MGVAWPMGIFLGRGEVRKWLWAHEKCAKVEGATKIARDLTG
jgi:hypothetical protein